MILETILITLTFLSLILASLIFRMARTIDHNKCCDHRDKYISLENQVKNISHNINFWGKEILKINGDQYKGESCQKDNEEKITALIAYLELEYVPKSFVEKSGYFKTRERVE